MKSFDFCYLLHNEGSLNTPVTGLRSLMNKDICLIQDHLSNSNNHLEQIDKKNSEMIIFYIQDHRLKIHMRPRVGECVEARGVFE